MVKGLETFRKAMQPYKEHFVIIGGTACDIQLTGSAMTPRATDDIDIIVVIEKLTEDFVRAIWQFVKDGNYKAEKRLSQQGQSVYALYRFTLQDEQLDYPQKIELLSRHSDLLGEPSGFRIEPIPTDEDSHSLSAIIMDDDYYDFTVHHTDEIDGLLVANNKALIVLKANAYLNLLKEREAGRQVNSKDIRKHRSDVLKLVAAGSYPDPQPVNSKIYTSIRLFLEEVNQHRQSLADALDSPIEAIDAYLDILRNEIFVEE
jgi:hypothetical protein